MTVGIEIGHESTSIDRGDDAIVRVSEPKEVTEAETAAIQAVAFQPFLESALRAQEERLLRATAWGPVHKLIAADKEAAQAVRQLAELGESRRNQSVRSINLPWSGPEQLPGADVFFPPFDIEQPMSPLPSGNNRSRVDKSNGRVYLVLMPPYGFSGAAAVDGRVGIVILSKKMGVVDIRPFIRIESYAMELGSFGLSAHCEAALTLQATRDASVIAHREIPLWSGTSQTEGHQEFYGVADPLQCSLQFGVEAGATYTVWIGGVVAGDQSGNDRFAGASHCLGELKARCYWLNVAVY